jgi:hypothetical protein
LVKEKNTENNKTLLITEKINREHYFLHRHRMDVALLAYLCALTSGWILDQMSSLTGCHSLEQSARTGNNIDMNIHINAMPTKNLGDMIYSVLLR